MNAMRWGVVAACWALQALPALAQTTPDAEALERAQRDADNPMRLIIEAGKIKSKGKAEADAKTEARADTKADDKAAAEKAPARAAAAKPAAPEPAVRVQSPEETRAAALASVRGLPAETSAATTIGDAAAPPVPAAAAPSVPSPEQAPAGAAARPDNQANAGVAPGGSSAAPETTPSSTLALKTPAVSPTAPPAAGTPTAPSPAAGDAATPVQATSATSPSLVSGGTALAATDAPPPAAVASAPQPEAERVALAVAPLAPQAPPVALELVNSVQPELPDRVRRRMRRDGEVLLVFRVNTDGSVADLNVQSSSDTALDAIALDAVRQWRYKPIAEARTHRLQLVFRVE